MPTPNAETGGKPKKPRLLVEDETVEGGADAAGRDTVRTKPVDPVDEADYTPTDRRPEARKR